MPRPAASRGKRSAGGRRHREVRTRILWVKGLLHARLGHFRRARRCLRAAYRPLLKEGLPREAMAVTLDRTQLGVRHWDPTDKQREAAQEVITGCLARNDLRYEHKIELRKMRDEVLKDYPYEAFRLIGQLRSSFIAPVPNRLDERIEPRQADGRPGRRAVE